MTTTATAPRPTAGSADELAYDLGRLALQISRRNRTDRRTDQLTPAQLGVLQTLADAQPRSSSELARAERVSTATMTRLLTHLSKAGLLARDPDPEDGRQILITLTDEGATALEAAHSDSNWLCRKIADLTASERRAIKQSITTLATLILTEPQT